jgi:hypothetical protein
MPVFNAKCNKCGVTKKLLTVQSGWNCIDRAKLVCTCGGKLQRHATGPLSSFTKEVLDNGAMPRAVERFSNMEELKQERLAKADPNAGRTNRS